MLTKQDLNQIKKIVDTSVFPIKKDLKKIDKKFIELEEHLDIRPVANY